MDGARITSVLDIAVRLAIDLRNGLAQDEGVQRVGLFRNVRHRMLGVLEEGGPHDGLELFVALYADLDLPL